MRPSKRQHVLVLLREELGLNQKDLADFVGCSESTLQAVERGPKRLKLSEALAVKIFQATGISPRWLMANDFNVPPYDGVDQEPYTKSVFEAIQAHKNLPHFYNIMDNRKGLWGALKIVLSVYGHAESASSSDATLVVYRVQQFATKLWEEFGGNDLLESKEAERIRLKTIRDFHELLNVINPKAQKMIQSLLNEEKQEEKPARKARSGRRK